MGFRLCSLRFYTSTLITVIYNYYLYFGFGRHSILCEWYSNCSLLEILELTYNTGVQVQLKSKFLFRSILKQI